MIARTELTVELYYTNWRGETRKRKLVPQRLWYGKTDWHPEPQWLLTCIDVEEDGKIKDFALEGFRGKTLYVPSTMNGLVIGANIAPEVNSLDDSGFPRFLSEIKP